MKEDKLNSRIWRSRISRRRVLTGAAVGGGALAAATLVGCGSGGSSSSKSSSSSGTSSGPSTKSGTITGAFSGVGQTLSPNSTALWATEFYAIYDQLARLEPDGSLQPSLALKWETENPSRWIFHLRDGVQWSDGKPFTADDVKFTYDYIADANNKSALISRVATVKSVEVLDAKTVAINTKSPDPLLPRASWFVHIMPKHYLGDLAFGDQAMATKPVGTGAYIADKYSQGSEISLKKNPNSWRGTKGLDGVDMKIITDVTTRLSAFQSGQVDMMDAVQFSDMQTVQAIKNAKLLKTPASAYAGYDLEYFDPPFNDKRVRMAFAHAIDYAGIQKTVYFGVPDVMQGQMLTKPTFGFDPNLKQYTFDPDTSRSLLKQAGVDKLNIKMEFVGDPGSTAANMAQAVAANLKDIGVTAELTPIDINVWRDGLYGRRKRATMMSDSWSSSASLEASIALQWMLSTNAGKFYNNPEFDSLYNQAITEFDDEKRKGLYQKAVEIMNPDPPGLWIVEGNQLLAYRTDKIAKLDLLGAPPIYFDEIVLA